MEPDVTRRQILGSIAGLGALLTGAVVLRSEPPRVVRIDSTFGSIRETSADIETTIVVENPNDRAIPGSHRIRYLVALNDITVANGRADDVRIDSDRTVIETSARFDNTTVPEWWVSHINSGESTTMESRTRVDLFGLPLRVSLPPEQTEIVTEFLDVLTEEEPSTVALGEHDLLQIGGERVEWREANEELSPLRFSADLENVHERPVGVDGTDYEIRMNGIIVGAGETTDGIELAPGESVTLETDAAIDTPRMQDWWVSHLRNEQSTRLQIAVLAVVIDEAGTRHQLPMRVVDRQASFETDMLGTGETIVEPLDSEPSEGLSEPQAEETTSEWGDVRDDETEIRTTVVVRNDNDETISELLTLEITQTISIAGVTAGTGIDRIETLRRGVSTVELTARKPHSVVPEWWAAHLQNGESSTTQTEVSGEADVAVTSLPVDLDDRESRVETNLLADLNDTTRQPVTGGGDRTLFIVHSTTAEWIDPTPQRGRIRVETDIENTQTVGLTIRDVDYTIDINDIVLADRRLPEHHRFGPRERKTAVFEFVLDNSRMEAWWPTHIRNDERSELDRQVAATVESDTTQQRLRLEFLSETVEVETDLLGGALTTGSVR